jgi:hypothetical protein
LLSHIVSIYPIYAIGSSFALIEGEKSAGKDEKNVKKMKSGRFPPAGAVPVAEGVAGQG